MIEQFNRINNAFGANRVRLEAVFANGIRFQIVGWSEFVVFIEGAILEHQAGTWIETARSRWLHAISLGKKRDDEGRVA